MNTSQVEYKEYNKKTNLRLKIIIIILIILFIGLLISIYLVQRRTRITGKAFTNSSINQVEINNSYLFASPLKAKANGAERIRITIFILDSQGKGVVGKEVVLGNSSKITVDPIQNKTDDIGKAIFDVTSKDPGLYILEASVNGQILPQRVNVTFE